MLHASETGRKSWRAWGLNGSVVLLLVGVGACQRESPADGKADFSSAAQPGGTSSNTASSSSLCSSAQDAALAQCQATTQAVSKLSKAAPTASSTTPASGAAQ